MNILIVTTLCALAGVYDVGARTTNNIDGTELANLIADAIAKTQQDVNDDVINNGIVEAINDTAKVIQDDDNDVVIAKVIQDANNDDVMHDETIKDVVNDKSAGTQKKTKKSIVQNDNVKRQSPSKTGLKICVDKRGDCKSMLQHCASLKGMCDESCGHCSGGVLGHKETFVFGLEEITLQKGKLVSRIPYIGREFQVSFDLLPTVFGTGTRNVIHFSVSNNDNRVNGDRVPSIWFHGSTPLALKNKLHICSDVSGNRNYCYNTNPYIEKNKWVNIKISQTHVFGGYYYSISIDGHTIHTHRNDRAAVYKNVYVYGAEPWRNSQEGMIKNLIIKTSL